MATDTIIIIRVAGWSQNGPGIAGPPKTLVFLRFFAHFAEFAKIHKKNLRKNTSF